MRVYLTKEQISTINHALDILESDYSTDESDCDSLKEKERGINAECDAVRERLLNALNREGL